LQRLEHRDGDVVFLEIYSLVRQLKRTIWLSGTHGNFVMYNSERR